MFDFSSLVIFVMAAMVLLITPGPAALFIVARSVAGVTYVGLGLVAAFADSEKK